MTESNQMFFFRMIVIDVKFFNAQSIKPDHFDSQRLV